MTYMNMREYEAVPGINLLMWTCQAIRTLLYDQHTHEVNVSSHECQLYKGHMSSKKEAGRSNDSILKPTLHDSLNIYTTSTVLKQDP